jgi:hypothetical protein
MTIIFRDRPLKPNETFHHYCDFCKVEIHPDMIQTHKCNKTWSQIHSLPEVLQPIGKKYGEYK